MTQNPRHLQTPTTSPHKGWHSRGYLPHFDQPDLVQSITFRLADALPAQVIESLSEDKHNLTDMEKRQRIEAYIDAGHGECFLRDPRIGQLVENAFLHFDGKRYRLLAWVIMPNHVHILIETRFGHLLDKIIHSWKSFTAHQANDLLGRSGEFWFPDYFDRFIRNERHFYNVVCYIHENPVKAGLVSKAIDWPFSSARFWERKRDARKTPL
jgi:putative DNA methylase